MKTRINQQKNGNVSAMDQKEETRIIDSEKEVTYLHTSLGIINISKSDVPIGFTCACDLKHNIPLHERYCRPLSGGYVVCLKHAIQNNISPKKYPQVPSYLEQIVTNPSDFDIACHFADEHQESSGYNKYVKEYDSA